MSAEKPSPSPRMLVPMALNFSSPSPVKSPRPGPQAAPSPRPSPSPVQQQDLDDLALARLLQEQERAYFLLSGQTLEGEAGEAAARGNDAQANAPPEGLDEDGMLAWRLMQEDQAAAMREMYLAQGIDPDNLHADTEIDPDAFGYAGLTTIGEVVGKVSKGLPQSAIDALPVTTYAQLQEQGKASLDKCCVCQLEFEGEDSAMLLPCCHYYHQECVTQWLTINKVCPMCNHEVPADKSA